MGDFKRLKSVNFNSADCLIDCELCASFFRTLERNYNGKIKRKLDKETEILFKARILAFVRNERQIHPMSEALYT